MRKTGWDPPALMQDDNPQLSQWFASRPDARYVFIRNQRREKMKYRVQVVMSYWQTVEVEADSSADAASKAFDEFDITKARVGEGETYDVELVELADKVKYVVRNHNRTVLGVFDNEHDAEKDAEEYRYQTGNPAYVDKEYEDES
jgi:hypothetical protein